MVKAQTVMMARMTRILASPWLMVAFFLLMAAGSLGIAYGWTEATEAALVPLGLLVVNLSAAIASLPRFRADLPLLVFHVALLVFVALLAAARLTYFEGTAKVAVGGAFTGDFRSQESGPLHPYQPWQLRFANAGFSESYPPENPYRHTDNRVRYRDEKGGMRESVIGDDHPLIVNGYRIYTSRNRGLAPALRWEGGNGDIELATLQLAELGEDGYSGGMDWQVPGGPPLWISLSTEPISRAPGSVTENLGVRSAKNSLVVRHDGQFHDLALGESLVLPQGKLTFSELNAWMGYRIAYDPTKPWLIATVGVAIASLLWFYFRRLWRTWDEDE